MKRKFLVFICAMIAHFSSARALTISSPPTFTRASGAPLSGTLDLETDIPSRVSVTIELSEALKTTSHRRRELHVPGLVRTDRSDSFVPRSVEKGDDTAIWLAPKPIIT